jgi:hypothetical protein
MARRPRRNQGAQFKARVALAAIRGEKTLTELTEQFDVHPHPITEWKSSCLSVPRKCSAGLRASRSPAGGCESAARKDRAVGAGERFFGRRAHQGGHTDRKKMIDPKLLGLFT